MATAQQRTGYRMATADRGQIGKDIASYPLPGFSPNRGYVAYQILTHQLAQGFIGMETRGNDFLHDLCSRYLETDIELRTGVNHLTLQHSYSS